MAESHNILKNFIVLEGLDGSGTSTQLDLLGNKLNEEEVSHYCTYEPTNNNIGAYIRKILKGDEVVCSETIAFLFAADRTEHLFEEKNGIISNINKNKLVICDRYIFSSLAYQSIDNDFNWVFNLNKNFPLPEHLIFLDTPVDICQDRIKNRDNTEIFENKLFQEKVYKGYIKSIDSFKNTQMKVHNIIGTLSPEKIFNSIWDIINSMPIMKK